MNQRIVDLFGEKRLFCGFLYAFAVLAASVISSRFIAVKYGIRVISWNQSWNGSAIELRFDVVNSVAARSSLPMEVIPFDFQVAANDASPSRPTRR